MIELLALFLLALRLIATGFLLNVLKKQRELMKRPIDTEITGFRRNLYYLTLGLAGSNMLPIIFDVFIITRGMGFVWFTISTTEFLIAYTVSNAAAALLAAVLVQRIYKNALQVDESHVTSDHTLMND